MSSPPQSGIVPGVAKVTFNEPSLEVLTGGTNTIQFTITAPPGLLAEYLPVYSGYIKLVGSNGETLRVPYQGLIDYHSKNVLSNQVSGVAADVHKDVPIWSDTIPTFPNVGIFMSGGVTVMPGDPFHAFNLNGDTGFDFPLITGFNTFATAEQRIDVSQTLTCLRV